MAAEKAAKNAKATKAGGAGSNPLSRDTRLKALLKPLLPAGTELSPMTFEQVYPSYFKGIELPQGVDVTRGKVEVGYGRKPQDAFTLRLHVLTALVPEKKANALVRKLQPGLRDAGYQALVTTHGHMDFCWIFQLGILPAEEKYGGKAMLAFFKAPEPWPLLFVRGTNGDNYEVYTPDLVARLREWSGWCDFAILGAGWDWVVLRLNTVPADLARFARELGEFCPDTNASEMSLAQVRKNLAEDKELFLWWD